MDEGKEEGRGDVLIFKRLGGTDIERRQEEEEVCVCNQTIKVDFRT